MVATLPTSELLRRLVAFPSISRDSNLPLVDFLSDYLDRPGVTLARNPSPDGRKANLVVRVGPPAERDDRAGLVLSGHTDVVPADEEGWESDPFELTDRGDRWVGRGTADMKGFLALAAAAATAVEPHRLDAPLVLLLTFDEEVGTLGARQLVDGWKGIEVVTGPLPRSALIGEPTELHAVARHKGHLKLRVTVLGRSAHSGYPHLGRNAIEAAGRAIVALTELRARLEAERPAAGRHFPEVPYAALNVGTVSGGAAINVVPDRCVIEVGVRVLPGMSSVELADRVQRTVAGVVPQAEHRFEVLSDSPPLEVPEKAPILRALARLTGEPTSGAVSFATDGGWLARLGLDCAVFGPGSITVAHRPNESLPKAELAAAARVVDGLVDRFCRSGA